VSIAHSGALTVQILGEALTPYFRVLRVKASWLNGVEGEYGGRQPFRELAAAATAELLEEAREEPDAVLEAVDQFSTLAPEQDN
jgi:hypothetical protein